MTSLMQNLAAHAADDTEQPHHSLIDDNCPKLHFYSVQGTSMQTSDTHSDSDFAAENLTARHDVEIPELGLLPPVEVELQLDCLENGERLPVDADPHLQPGVEHSLVDGDLNAKDMSCCRYD